MKEKLSKMMDPFDRHIPYNALPPLPPEMDLYKDKGVIGRLMRAGSAIENIFTTEFARRTFCQSSPI